MNPNSKATKVLRYAVKKGYRMEDNGSVIGLQGREIASRIATTGYYRFSVHIDGGRSHVQPHQLMAFLKYGEELFQADIDVRHLDGDSLNNSKDNIVLGSHSQNMMDQPKSNRIAHAKKASTSIRKFSNEDVTKIRARYDEVKSYKLVMKEFGITSTGTLHYLIHHEYVTSKG